MNTRQFRILVAIMGTAAPVAGLQARFIDAPMGSILWGWQREGHTCTLSRVGPHSPPKELEVPHIYARLNSPPPKGEFEFCIPALHIDIIGGTP